MTIYASITYNIAHEYTRLRINTILKCIHTLEEKSLVDIILSFYNKFVSDEFSLNSRRNIRRLEIGKNNFRSIYKIYMREMKWNNAVKSFVLLLLLQYGCAIHRAFGTQSSLISTIETRKLSTVRIHMKIQIYHVPLLRIYFISNDTFKNYTGISDDISKYI